MALEIKYRPIAFEELVGWNAEKESLLSIIHTKRTYLISGPRGCGKTTIARLIAYKLNTNDFDIIEIDAATNTGIDDAREIKKSAQVFPTMSSQKVYIIDEVHRLSPQAFDSLLKLLEEPPKHCYFVLCTTEIQKVPATIQSRAAKYEVKPLTSRESVQLLDWVCHEEKIMLSPNIRDKIIQKCDGIPREMIVALEMVKDMNNEDEAVSLIKSLQTDPQIIDLCRALINKSKWMDIVAIVKELKDEPEQIRYAVLGYMNSVLMKEENPRAALVMSCFTESFYYSKKPGLTLACFMSIKS